MTTTRTCHHDTTTSHVDGEAICGACESTISGQELIDLASHLELFAHIPGAHEDGACYCSTPLEDRPHHPCSACGNPVPIGECICSCRIKAEHVPLDQL